MTTLRQGNQVLNLILQQKTSREQLQKLLASGLLSDLLSGNLEGTDRNRFRKVLGLRPISPDPSMGKQTNAMPSTNRPRSIGARVGRVRHGGTAGNTPSPS